MIDKTLMSWTIRTFHNDAGLVGVLAEEIARRLQAAVVSRDEASLAVSGGSTPKALFTRLCGADIEWDKVTVTLVDERWVSEQHPDSNAQLVRTHLLKDRARYARFVGLKTSEQDAFAAVDSVNRLLNAVPMPLDVLVLGMGTDGHTASFFSGAEGTALAMDPSGTRRCAAVAPVAAPHQRMTLTMPVILSARHAYLHTVGSDKQQVLEKALSESAEQAAAAQATGVLPIAAVLHRFPGTVQIYHAEQGA